MYTEAGKAHGEYAHTHTLSYTDSVVEIGGSGLSLKGYGTLPTELGYLTDLTYGPELAANGISGTVPTGITWMVVFTCGFRVYVRARDAQPLR